jgi:hypothetical protein
MSRSFTRGNFCKDLAIYPGYLKRVLRLLRKDWKLAYTPGKALPAVATEMQTFIAFQLKKSASGKVPLIGLLTISSRKELHLPGSGD